MKDVEISNERDDKIQSIEENITEGVLANQRKHLEKELCTLKDIKIGKGNLPLFLTSEIE